jgi:DNA-binding response OmpR family regulator
MTRRHDQPSPDAAEPSAAARRSACVLIVEDDPPTLHLLGHTLREAGFAVVMTGNGTTALEMLRDDPAIRVVLLDLEMPGFSGWEFRRAQRADRKLAAVPTVVITSTALDKIVDNDLRAADYLLKPVSPEHLVSVITKYCERQR